MSEIIAEGMHNDQRVITVKSISGDPVTLNEKIAEVVVDTGSGKQRCVAVKQFGGGGGGGTDDYTHLENKPKINNVTLSGNKTGADLGLVDDVQVNGISIVTDGVANIPVASQDTLGVAKVSQTYGLTVSNGIIVGSTKTASVYSTAANSLAVCKGTLDNIKDDFVRSVRPAYTEITASSATYTLSSNATFGQTPSQAVTYTLPTVIAGVDNWCKLFVDCTTTASIAFTTTDSTTITPVGSPTITQGNSYIFVCQYDNLAETWKVFLVDATV